MIRFTDEDISYLSEELKDELLKDGAVKVDTVIEDVAHIYTDLDGNDYIVTEENSEEVNQIRENDIKRIQKGKVTTLSTDLESYTNGAFSGEGIVTYMGKTANNTEFIYKYRTSFKWSSRPTLYFVDTIGTSWKSHTTSTSSSGDYRVNLFSTNGTPLGSQVYGLNDLDYSNIYGTKAKVDISFQAGEHVGWLEDVVNIPVTHNGTSGQFASAYAHAHTNFDISLTFKAVGFDFTGLGDKWSWKNTFTIGSSY